MPTRPNKTATGMMLTHERSQNRSAPVALTNPFYPYLDEHKKDVGRLLVYGTCDSLAGTLRRTFLMRKGAKRCPCCQQPDGKYRLTDAGRRKLEKMRKKSLTM